LLKTIKNSFGKEIAPSGPAKERILSNRGFTLIEMAVVLAIIAVLAAVLTPMVTNYLDQARVVRATADVKTIADAIRLYERDTAKWPIFTSSGQSSAVATELVGPGNAPTAGASWAAYTTTTGLIGQLNTNFLGLSTGSQVTNPGRVAYRGPYIGALDSDPWGNQYVVTATNLNSGVSNWAIVISAGPNGTLDSNPNQANTATFTATNDDIVAIIK